MSLNFIDQDFLLGLTLNCPMLFPETIMTISERNNFHVTLPQTSCRLIELLSNVNPKQSKEDKETNG